MKAFEMTQTQKIMIEHINTLRKTPKDISAHKPPVLLIHGAWHGAWCWEGNYLDYFSNAGHETWAMDLSGHGDSRKKKPLRFTPFDDYLTDINTVINAMPAPPFIIGHSMGGFLCQHIFNDNSDIRGVGLLASLPANGVNDIALTVHPLKKLQASLTFSLYPMVSDRKNAKYMFLDPDADEAALDYLMDNLGGESTLAFMKIGSGKAHPKKPDMPLKTPVCVVAAEADTIIPVEIEERLAERFGVKANIIPNAPHDLMLSKKWEDSARIFLGWIETLTDIS